MLAANGVERGIQRNTSVATIYGVDAGLNGTNLFFFSGKLAKRRTQDVVRGSIMPQRQLLLDKGFDIWR